MVEHLQPLLEIRTRRRGPVPPQPAVRYHTVPRLEGQDGSPPVHGRRTHHRLGEIKQHGRDEAGSRLAGNGKRRRVEVERILQQVRLHRRGGAERRAGPVPVEEGAVWGIAALGEFNEFS